jgi:hypothetical protein
VTNTVEKLCRFRAAHGRLINRVLPSGREYARKRRLAFAKLRKHGIREAVEVAVHRMADQQQLLGLLNRKETQQHRVEHGKDRRVGADAKRQGQHRDGSKAGRFREGPQTIARIL